MTVWLDSVSSLGGRGGGRRALGARRPRRGSPCRRRGLRLGLLRPLRPLLFDDDRLLGHLPAHARRRFAHLVVVDLGLERLPTSRDVLGLLSWRRRRTNHNAVSSSAATPRPIHSSGDDAKPSTRDTSDGPAGGGADGAVAAGAGAGAAGAGASVRGAGVVVGEDLLFLEIDAGGSSAAGAGGCAAGAAVAAADSAAPGC